MTDSPLTPQQKTILKKFGFDITITPFKHQKLEVEINIRDVQQYQQPDELAEYIKEKLRNR
ncbi:MAG: hypothetical protein H0Z33_14960 [Bacillaceae bacterium]|nr:hypothetical protein [Bacillaceae bacterium]